jgi:hypothetical protein
VAFRWSLELCLIASGSGFCSPWWSSSRCSGSISPEVWCSRTLASVIQTIEHTPVRASFADTRTGVCVSTGGTLAVPDPSNRTYRALTTRVSYAADLSLFFSTAGNPHRVRSG